MSYLVMARRWRPQSFSDVVGQEHVTRTLQHAISRGRVAHAYIFTGPRGVGKTTTARLLAKAVNCRQMNGDGEALPEPCNECDTCKDITSGGSIDVIEIDGASNNKVEDVRNLRENVKFAPLSLQRKVYIIDEVHMLSVSAFNALLKTLEEPPDHAMFIFATTEIHKVPPTVLSRCQRFDFKRIPAREIRDHLSKIVEADAIKIDDDALMTIAIRAEGALRDALSILDQLVAYQGDDPITGDIVRQALGMIGPELYFRATDLAATGDVAAALALADDLANGGHDVREFLKGMQKHVLTFLQLRAGIPAKELDVADVYRGRYAEKQDQHSDEDLLQMGEWAAETEDLVRDVLDPRVRMELFLVRLARMDRAIDLGALLEKMGVQPASFKKPMKNGAVPIPKASEATTPAQSKKEPQAAEKKTEGETNQDDPANTSDDRSDEDDESGSEDQGPDPPPPDPAPVAPVTGASLEPSDNDIDEPGEDDLPPSENGEEEGEQLTLVQLKDDWLLLCEAVGAKFRLVGSALEYAAPVKLNGDSLTIAFEPKDDFHRERAEQKQDKISKALFERYGVRRQILLITEVIPDDLRPQRRKTSREVQTEAFRQQLEKNPVWQQLVQRLDLELDNES